MIILASFLSYYKTDDSFDFEDGLSANVAMNKRKMIVNDLSKNPNDRAKLFSNGDLERKHACTTQWADDYEWCQDNKGGSCCTSAADVLNCRCRGNPRSCSHYEPSYNRHCLAA